MEFPDPTPGPDESRRRDEGFGGCAAVICTSTAVQSQGVSRSAVCRSTRNPVIGGPRAPAVSSRRIGTGVSEKIARIGQRVMVHHYKGCTVCEHCRSGWSQLCQEEPVQVYGKQRSWRGMRDI